MEQYDDTFQPADDVPTIKEIEKRLRRLGCTNEQVSRHLEQVTRGRTKPAPIGARIVLTGSTGRSAPTRSYEEARLTPRLLPVSVPL